MKKTLQISLEDAKEMIKVLPSMKNTLEELYPELKPPVVPSSWYKIDGELRGFYIHSSDSAIMETGNTVNRSKANINVFATEKQAQSALAYAQLTQLMKATGDCDVDWADHTKTKYTIIRTNNRSRLDYAHSQACKLAFNTNKIAKEFFEKHRELIDIYHEL